MILALLWGAKHALDADHLAAVSTMVTERRSLFRSSVIGALWGLGHTLSLLVGGVLVIILRFKIDQRTSEVLELCVGVMLIFLGINAFRRLAQGGTIHAHVHEHDGYWHTHPHVHHKDHRDEAHRHHGWQPKVRPLLVGMAHGMAGSAALTMLVVGSIASPLAGFLYIAVFGIGSMIGMIIISSLMALPPLLLARRFERANLLVRVMAAGVSCCFGVFLIYQIAFVNHLLL